MTRFFDRFRRSQLRPMTPLWAEELLYRSHLNRINQEYLMAAIDDLKAGLAELKTQIDTSNAEIERLLAKLAAGSTDADIAAATQSVKDIAATSKAETDKSAAAAP